MSRGKNPATVDQLERYSLAELEAMPTLSSGHFEDLKVDSGEFRWWVTRMTRADGETHAVHVEEYIPNVGWRTVHKYHPLPMGNPGLRGVKAGHALGALGLALVGIGGFVLGRRAGRQTAA